MSARDPNKIHLFIQLDFDDVPALSLSMVFYLGWVSFYLFLPINSETP